MIQLAEQEVLVKNLEAESTEKLKDVESISEIYQEEIERAVTAIQEVNLQALKQISMNPSIRLACVMFALMTLLHKKKISSWP